MLISVYGISGVKQFFTQSIKLLFSKKKTHSLAQWASPSNWIRPVPTSSFQNQSNKIGDCSGLGPEPISIQGRSTRMGRSDMGTGPGQLQTRESPTSQTIGWTISISMNFTS
jgi:hypothetical protein